MKKIFFLIGFFAVFAMNVFANFDDFYGDILYNESSPKSFRNGYFAGIHAVAFQAKVDGFHPKIIAVKKPYVVAIDIKNMSLDEALFLQIIAHREGYDTHLTREYIILGQFQREVDAKKIVKDLKNRYKVQSSSVRILKNLKEIITYPYLFSDFFEEFLTEAKANGVLEVIKIVERPKIIKKQIKEVKKPIAVKTKTFVLKNLQAMSYSLSNNDESDSKNFNDYELKKNNKYIFEKSIITKQGEKFIKVKNQNLYFSDLDIILGD